MTGTYFSRLICLPAIVATILTLTLQTASADAPTEGEKLFALKIKSLFARNSVTHLSCWLQFLFLLVTISVCAAEAPSSVDDTSGLTAQPLAPRGASESDALFTLIDGKAVGIDFHNQLDNENIKNYLLTGAGLAVGDFDGNGLPDLFLVSQDGANKLYRQTAPWKFEDVTEAAGIKDEGRWGSGAAFADIDDDGDLDLYVCNKAAHDVMYLNEGDGTFETNEFAAGDAKLRAPTMVAFADYDQDGDLDMYRTETRLLSIREMFNHKLKGVKGADGKFTPIPSQRGHYEKVGEGIVEVGTFDHFYRSEATKPGDLHFRDVTRKAGIAIAREHGLAAIWCDYNNDNAPDLYVSNDFHTPDHFYRNNRDGTFSDITGDALPYTSWNSMGNDVADVNNDGWFDVLSTDMSATTHFKQKTMMGAMVATAWFLDNLEPRQYMRNALQINTGTGKFIDVAFHAGLDSTDWTWSGIFGDLDNDGWQDAYFTNGIERNVQDSDLNLRMAAAKKAGKGWDAIHQLMLDTPRFKEANLAFKNVGDLKFTDTSKSWGLDDLTVSHGAAFADLDRDGDLDLVVNNMNDPVGIYRNEGDGEKRHAILVSLRGEESNHFGLGARVDVTLPDGQTLARSLTSCRGYMSGVEPVLHFGLGENAQIQSLKVTWPSGRMQSFTDLKADQHFTIEESAANERFNPDDSKSLQPWFESAGDPKNNQTGIEFVHVENEFDDFAEQPLLPNRLSREGPALAAGDINGDRRPDLFIGAAAGSAGALFIQTESGTYRSVTADCLKADSSHEDVAAEWLDVDDDGDLDLYVVSGGADKPAQHPHYQDRLYLNDGKGNLQDAPVGSLPKALHSGSCVASCDFDDDGDVDLFVGSRHVPGRYPTVPKSILLRNDGGKFSIAESSVAMAGLVTDATWSDVTGDGVSDLIVATEWGPIKVYKNNDGELTEVTNAVGLAGQTGWWNCVAAADIDGDGDTDLLAGNFGSNTKYHVDEDHPATLYASDFGGQGKLQLVEAQCKEGKLLPVRGRSCSTSAMPHLNAVAPTYKAFALKSLEELYTPEKLDDAVKLEARTLQSLLFRNDGSGRFAPETLPILVQMSPVMDIAVDDFDRDGLVDVAIGQNFNDAQRETGRMNAGLGVILRGSKSGQLDQLPPRESGFFQRTNMRRLLAEDLNQDGVTDLLSANNGMPVTVHFGVSRRQPKRQPQR